MSKGKYSPALTREMIDQRQEDYIYNCHKQIAPDFNKDVDVYDSELHFADYDKDGFDSYGYSAFDSDGNFVGHGQGIDRWGYTEDEYLAMSDEEFNNL